VKIDNIYLLKDLARLSGQSVHTLKFYLKRGLIREVGRSPLTRFRFFNDTTLQRLTAIRALQKQQKTLSEILQFLSTSNAQGSEVREEGAELGIRNTELSEI